MKYQTGAFEADGAIIYVPVGFQPDYVELMDFNTSTNIIFYHWWKNMQDEMATGLQEGASVTEGVTARLADDGGIIAYDTGSDSPTITEYASVGTPTARTATTAGTYTRPSTSGTNVDGDTADREALFENVTSSGAIVTEPTWPVSVGEQVTDDGSNVWELVVTPKKRIGYQGFTIAAALMTDGRFYFYNAFLADKSVYHGDVVAWPSGVYDGAL
jgi:hypothetical protein